MQYGTKYLTAYVAYYFRMNSEVYKGTEPGERAGVRHGLPAHHARSDWGAAPRSSASARSPRTTPDPGQWGWGIFGPMLALRGYG